MSEDRTALYFSARDQIALDCRCERYDECREPSRVCECLAIAMRRVDREEGRDNRPLGDDVPERVWQEFGL